MEDINTSKINIIDQIASYSQSATENFLFALEDEYEAQIKLNNVLKKKNSEENIKSIENFISRNKHEINSQLEKLNSLKNNLKKIIEENKELKETEQDYDETINSEESVELANKLIDIKKGKDEIIFFLNTLGIRKLR